MRQRHVQVTASIDFYEGRLSEQQTQLSRLNRSRDFIDDDQDVAEVEAQADSSVDGGRSTARRRRNETIREEEEGT